MINPLVVFCTQELHMFETGVSATLRFDYGKHNWVSNGPVKMNEYATPERMAEVQKELEAAMDFLRKETGVKTVTLWGYSFGTMAVIEYMRHFMQVAKDGYHPDGFELGNVILLGGPGQEGVEKAVEAVQTGDGAIFPWAKDKDRHLLMIGGELELQVVEEQRKLHQALQTEKNTAGKLTTDIFVVPDVDHFYGTRLKNGQPSKWRRLQSAVEAVAAEVAAAAVPGNQEQGAWEEHEWRAQPVTGGAEDRKIYSFLDLQEKYKGEFSDNEITEYWEKEMVTSAQAREEQLKAMEINGFSGDPDETPDTKTDAAEDLEMDEATARGKKLAAQLGNAKL